MSATTNYIERARDNAAAHLEQAQLIKRQYDEANEWFNSGELCPPNVRITCICGIKFGLEWLFRCYYCGVWFCESCAEKHFGKEHNHAENK